MDQPSPTTPNPAPQPAPAPVTPVVTPEPTPTAPAQNPPPAPLNKAAIIIKIAAAVAVVAGLLKIAGGFLGLLVTSPTSTTYFTALSVSYIVFGVAIIISVAGLWKMKRWGLYTFSGLTVLSSSIFLYNVILGPGDALSLDLILQVLVTATLWVKKDLFLKA